MTEAEWNGCADPRPMLQFLHRKQSRRKQRLFACACCRLVWERIPPAWKPAVEVSEAYADGSATRDQLIEARNEAESTLLRRADIDFLDVDSPRCACDIAHSSPLVNITATRAAGLRHDEKPKTGAQAAILAQTCDLLRDIFCPFRTRASLRSLRNVCSLPPVPELARAIYEERGFDRCPILADALEEAGCNDAEVLGHLRGPGPHCRGCWVVDAMLAKE